MSYMLTLSGVQVSADAGVPSLSDIAVSLSRMPRFAGHTRQPWSVLEHSLFVAQLVERNVASIHPLMQDRLPLIKAALLHDAHEALTGDTPTPLKTAGLRLLQESLDVRIEQEHLGRVLGRDEHAHIHTADRQALLAEALVLGPPVIRTEADVERHFGEPPEIGCVGVLHTLLHDLSLAGERQKQLAAAQMLFLRMLSLNVSGAGLQKAG